MLSVLRQFSRRALQAQTFQRCSPIYKMSSQQEEQKESADDRKERLAREAALRIKAKEEKEIEDLRESFEASDSKFSTAQQLFKLIRMKLFLGGTLLFSIYSAYQFFQIIEFHVDPVDGTKKMIPMNKKEEKKLGQLISSLYQGENTILNNSPTHKRLLQKLKEVQKKFQRYNEINLDVNGNIYIIDKESFVFFMLPNGDLFVSKRAAIQLKPEELMSLFALELSHTYLRSSTRNLPWDEMISILTLKIFFEFSETAFSSLIPLQKIRQFYTIPISLSQEQNNMVMTADLLDELGMDVESPDQLSKYFQKLINTFTSAERPFLLDFKSKHCNL